MAEWSTLQVFSPSENQEQNYNQAKNDLRRQSVVHQIEAYLRKEFSDTSVPPFPTINILR